MGKTSSSPKSTGWIKSKYFKRVDNRNGVFSVVIKKQTPKDSLDYGVYVVHPTLKSNDTLKSRQMLILMTLNGKFILKKDGNLR